MYKETLIFMNEKILLHGLGLEQLQRNKMRKKINGIAVKYNSIMIIVVF